MHKAKTLSIEGDYFYINRQEYRIQNVKSVTVQKINFYLYLMLGMIISYVLGRMLGLTYPAFSPEFLVILILNASLATLTGGLGYLIFDRRFPLYSLKLDFEGRAPLYYYSYNKERLENFQCSLQQKLALI